MVFNSELSFVVSPLVISRTLHRDLRLGFVVKPDWIKADERLFMTLSSIIHMSSMFDNPVHVIIRSSGRWIYGVTGQVWGGRGSKSDKVYIGTRPNVVFTGLLFPEQSQPFEVDDDCFWDLYEFTMDSIWDDIRHPDDLPSMRMTYHFTVCDYYETRWFRDSVNYIRKSRGERRRLILIDLDPKYIDTNGSDYIMGPTELYSPEELSENKIGNYEHIIPDMAPRPRRSSNKP